MAEARAVPEGTVGFAVPMLTRFSELVVAALGEAREEIDALNVYPVPDGDTGTNLFLTFEAAHEALRRTLDDHGGTDRADVVSTAAAYARGLLLGARGNSGVITSQLLGALLRRLASPDRERPAVVLAQALVAAADAGYAAVGRPVEGTILTVARAAADAATSTVADPAAHTADVLEAAVRAATRALARTPEQLPVLRAAGVVDAGGRGFCVVLEAAEAAFTGRREVSRRSGPRRGFPARPVPSEASLAGAGEDLCAEGPAYEVMYLLDAHDDQIPALRARLQSLGDSLVVVGGDGLWNVHVHVDDVGPALEAGIEAGRPHRVRVTHFAEQVAKARAAERARRAAPSDGQRAVVAVSIGPGLSQVYREAGAVVVENVALRPSTEDLLTAIGSTGSREVLLLPNHPDVLPVAQAAARLAAEEQDARVAVVATRSQVQGMAALAVHEPGRAFDEDLVEMSAAARHARSGAVTRAARRAMTSAGPCEPGDVLGSVEGDFVVVGQDLLAVAVAVLERLLGGGGELVTLLAGEGAADLAERCARHLRDRHPSVDVLVYDGGQQRYPLMVGVE